MAALGDTLYHMTGDTNATLNVSRDIGVQDLVSGAVQAPFVSLIGIGKAMATSPDGSWLAIIREESAGFYVNVFDLQTGQLVYSDQAYASNNRPLLAWAAASDQLAYTYSDTQSNNLDLCARVISSAT